MSAPAAASSTQNVLLLGMAFVTAEYAAAAQRTADVGTTSASASDRARLLQLQAAHSQMHQQARLVKEQARKRRREDLEADLEEFRLFQATQYSRRLPPPTSLPSSPFPPLPLTPSPQERARSVKEQDRLLKERARSDKAARRAARERFKAEQQQRIEARRLRRLGLAPCPLPRHPRRPQWLRLMPTVCDRTPPPAAAAKAATPPLVRQEPLRPPPKFDDDDDDDDDYKSFLSEEEDESAAFSTAVEVDDDESDASSTAVEVDDEEFQRPPRPQAGME